MPNTKSFWGIHSHTLFKETGGKSCLYQKIVPKNFFLTGMTRWGRTGYLIYKFILWSDKCCTSTV